MYLCSTAASGERDQTRKVGEADRTWQGGQVSLQGPPLVYLCRTAASGERGQTRKVGESDRTWQDGKGTRPLADLRRAEVGGRIEAGVGERGERWGRGRRKG